MRLVTWNIHGGLGRDGRRDLGRIAALLEDMRSDVAALQEVGDAHRGNLERELADQASWLGRRAKSRVRTRICISAPRNSRLTSARSDARSAVRNALSTSRSPAVKAIPLTRNPPTGIAASRMMRVRTEMRVMMR